MFQKLPSIVVMDASQQKLAQRSKQASAEKPATDRACSGANDTVTKRDRRRSRGRSPNSRQNHSSVPGRVSSHLQERDMFMDPTARTLVGIDIAKYSLDVYVASDGRSFTIKNTSAGFRQLLDELPATGNCLVVV